MKRNRKGKYDKVTQQQKFHLLHLVVKEGLSIKEAATEVNVKYSTAKTIIFFHRNQEKSYQFDLRTLEDQETPTKKTAMILDMCGSKTLRGNIGVVSIISTIGERLSEARIIDWKKTSDSWDLCNNVSPGLALYAPDPGQFMRRQNCQCERRTRAQSNLQAVQISSIQQDCICPLPHPLNHSP